MLEDNPSRNLRNRGFIDMATAVSHSHTSLSTFSSNNLLQEQYLKDHQRKKISPVIDVDLEFHFIHKYFLYCHVDGHFILLPRTQIPQHGFTRSLKEVVRVFTVICSNKDLFKILNLVQRIHLFFNALMLNHCIRKHNLRVLENSCLSALDLLTCWCIKFQISHISTDFFKEWQQNMFQEHPVKGQALETLAARSLMFEDRRVVLNFNFESDSRLIFEVIQIAVHLNVDNLDKTDRDHYLLILAAFYNSHLNDGWLDQLEKCISTREYFPLLKVLFCHIVLNKGLINHCLEFLNDILAILINHEDLWVWDMEALQAFHELSTCMFTPETTSESIFDKANRMFRNVSSIHLLFMNNSLFYDVSFCENSVSNFIKINCGTEASLVVRDYLTVRTNVYTIALNVTAAVQTTLWLNEQNGKAFPFNERMQHFVVLYRTGETLIDALICCFTVPSEMRRNFLEFLSDDRSRCMNGLDFIRLLIQRAQNTLTEEEKTLVTHIEGYINAPQLVSPVPSPITSPVSQVKDF